MVCFFIFPFCDFDDRVGSNSKMEMSCQSNGNSSDIQPICNSGDTSYQDERYSGYMPPPFVSGWMYVNEQGQMCGPYIQQQLYEGLCTGFLPDELPVYPVVNEAYINPIPLKYFKQFPDHVATGFAYLSLGSISSTSTPTNSFKSCNGDLATCRIPTPVTAAYPDLQFDSTSQANYNTNVSNQPISNSKAPNLVTSYQSLVFILVYLSFPSDLEIPYLLRIIIRLQITVLLILFSLLFLYLHVRRISQSSKESCWLYEDEEGKRNGPYSLFEINSWHQYGYLRDSLMVRYEIL